MRSAATTTDGWRGLPGPTWSELDLLTAVQHAAATGALGSHVLVGFDTRAGSREIAALITNLLTRDGVTVSCADAPAPTPALGRFVRSHQHLSAAIIVTASHNPPGFVGVKLRDGEGLGGTWPLPPDGASIEPDTLAQHPEPAPDQVPVVQHYAETVGERLTEAVHRFTGSLTIDTAHGVVGALATHLTAISWARATPLPFFAGHTPDPTLPDTAIPAANACLRAASDPQNTLVAMVDGDGDRLVLYTAASGCIGSAEQAAVLLADGLSVEHLLTTSVAPRMLIESAGANPGTAVTQTSVGFKHLVAAWRETQHPQTLAVEPNGALVWAHPGDDYFERDSLTALTTVLTRFASVARLDQAISDLRRRYPYPQQILTVASAVDDVRAQLDTLLSGWQTSSADTGTRVFADAAEGYITVRASGTEPVTRLYTEVSPKTLRTITESLS